MKRLAGLLLLATHAYALPSADTDLGGVKYWASRRLGHAEDDFAIKGGKRMPSPAFWGDEVVYQIMVDRFNNGDTKNDRLNIEEGQRQNEFKSDVGIQDYRHGGDIQGIINRLGYLQTLGVTSLWITPVFKNANGSYHGYCTSDFTEIDPGFGSNELFRELVAQAHARGMRVVLDIVVNHMCDQGTRYKTQGSAQDYQNCTTDLEKRNKWNEQNIFGRRELEFSKNFFAPFRSQHFFSRCGHREGDFETHGYGALYGDFSDLMFDFDTNNADFQEIFTDIHKWWIAYADIDGFRVDAAKHVTPDFMAKLSTETRAYAESLGKKNFFLVGEIAGAPVEQAIRVGNMRGNIHSPDASTDLPGGDDLQRSYPFTLKEVMKKLKALYSQHAAWAKPGLNAVYDFAQSGSIREMWHGLKSPLGVKQWFYDGGETVNGNFANGYGEIAAQGDTRTNWNVVEIHDWPRFAIHKAPVLHMIGAMGHLMTSVGSPVIFYGFEQGLNGDCHHSSMKLSDEGKAAVLQKCGDSSAHNHGRYRQDMFMNGRWRLGSQVPQVNGLAGIGSSASAGDYANWREDPYLATDHELFQAIRRFTAIRKSCVALRQGGIFFRAAHDQVSGGLLAYSRIFENVEMLVIVNNSDNAIPLSNLIIDNRINVDNGRQWVNLLNAGEKGLVGDIAPGVKGLFFTGFAAAPRSVSIFVDGANYSEWKDDIGSHLCLK